MERIGNEVERTLAGTGSRDAIPLAAVTAAWPDAVGDAVARKAWPLRLSRDGTLHVAAASSTWAHELDLLQDEILVALRARLGDVSPSKLRFAVGPIPEPASAASEAAPVPAHAPPEVPPEVAREASSAASVIDDPELRELVSRAARASLFKARSGRHFW
jgi:hypothetical protein